MKKDLSEEEDSKDNESKLYVRQEESRLRDHKERLELWQIMLTEMMISKDKEEKKEKVTW